MSNTPTDSSMETPTTDSETSTEQAIKPVVALLYVNLGISIVLAALTFLLKNSILDYQVHHLISAGTITAGEATQKRHDLAGALWIRPATVLLIAFIYVRLAARMKLGRRRTYVRLWIIGVAGFLGIAYVVATAEFPVWMRIGQAVQAVVLLGLLAMLATRTVRSHFGKKPAEPAMATGVGSSAVAVEPQN